MYNDITGIILSGGKSTRMGINKSLLKVGNKTIIEIMTDLMKVFFENVILITNDPNEYKFLDIPLFSDVYSRMGPLAGIHSGLVNTTTENNFIISCDLPLMNYEMIDYLIKFPTTKLITISKAEGFIQQLCGIYSKECLIPADKILKTQMEEESRMTDQKRRGCKVLSLIKEIDAEIIDAESLPFYNRDLFFNMNKQDDYEYLLNKMSHKIEL